MAAGINLSGNLAEATVLEVNATGSFGLLRGQSSLPKSYIRGGLARRHAPLFRPDTLYSFFAFPFQIFQNRPGPNIFLRHLQNGRKRSAKPQTLRACAIQQKLDLLNKHFSDHVPINRLFNLYVFASIRIQLTYKSACQNDGYESSGKSHQVLCKDFESMMHLVGKMTTYYADNKRVVS